MGVGKAGAPLAASGHSNLRRSLLPITRLEQPDDSPAKPAASETAGLMMTAAFLGFPQPGNPSQKSYPC